MLAATLFLHSCPRLLALYIYIHKHVFLTSSSRPFSATRTFWLGACGQAPGDLGVEPIDDLHQLLPLNAGVFAATSPDGGFRSLSDNAAQSASTQSSPLETTATGAAAAAAAAASGARSNASPNLPGPELSPTHADAASAEGFDDSAYVSC